MKRFAISLLAAVVLSGTGPVLAQEVPPGQSCGGLLCDMGVFGHKVPVGQEGAPAAQPTAAAPVEAASAPAAEPTPRKIPRKKRVAKAIAPKTARETAKVVATAPAATKATVPLETVAKGGAKEAAATPRPAPATAAVVANPWEVDGSNPAARPAAAMFRPLY